MRTNKLIFGILMFVVLSGLVATIDKPYGMNNDFKDVYQAETGPAYLVLQNETVFPRFSPGVNMTADTDRNITITASASVLVTDTVKVEFNANSTPVKLINYTLPAFFDQYVVYYKFYVALNKTVDNALGQTLGQQYYKENLETPENYRVPQVIKDLNYTYYVFPLNNTNPEKAYFRDVFVIRAYFWMENAVKTYLDEKEWQRVGYINESLFPLLTSVSIDNGTCRTYLQSNLDKSINVPVTNPENISDSQYNVYLGRIENDFKTLTFTNRHREAFDPAKGLNYNDTATYFFKSQDGAPGLLGGIASYNYESIVRDVYVDSWGRIKVVENITVRNTGPSIPPEVTMNLKPKGFALINVPVVLPLASVPLDVYDSSGPLNPQKREAKTKYPIASLTAHDGYKTIDVALRYPLYGGQTYSFMVEYELNVTDFLEGGKGNLTLNMPLSSWFNTTVKHFTLNIHLPTGSAIMSHNIRPHSRIGVLEVDYECERSAMSIFRNRVFVVNGYNLTSVDNVYISINYSFARFYYVAPVINWSLVVFLFLLVYVLLRQINVQVEAVVVEKEAIPVEEIKAFLKDYGEKEGIVKRRAQLRKKYRSKQLKKREYEQQLRKLDMRTRQVIQRLEKSIKNLKAQGPTYQNIVEKIMLADQKREDIQRNIDQLETNYRLKKVPKDLYQRLTHEYNKELSKVDSIIHKELSNLKLLVERE